MSEPSDDILKLAREHTAETLKAAKSGALERRRRRAAGLARWPIESDSLACHPEQVQERNAFIKGHGLQGCEARPDGTMVFSGPRARQRYLSRVGLIDRSGYT